MRTVSVPISNGTSIERTSLLAIRSASPPSRHRVDDDELVPAEPHGRAGRRDRVTDAAGHRDHEAVADLVAVGVVDELEAVEVAEQRRRLHGDAARLVQTVGEDVGQRDAILQVGERIVARQPAQLAAGARGDVGLVEGEQPEGDRCDARWR